MASSDSITLARLFYYARERLFGTMQTVLLECKEKYGADPVLTFYEGLALLMQEQVPDAMRELSTVREHRDVSIASSLALIVAHKKARIVDKEAVNELEVRVKNERSTAGEQALYFAGVFLIACGRPDKAKDYFNKMVKNLGGRCLEGSAMLGWCELLMQKEGYLERATSFFRDAKNNDKTHRDINTFVGLARVNAMKGETDAAVDLINQAVVQNPKILCCLLEKLNILVAIQQWDQVTETANRYLNRYSKPAERILAVNKYAIQAQAVVILHALCREGNYKDAAQKIVELIESMDRFEPKAKHYYHLYSACFSRMCGSHPLILQQTQTLLERAISLDSENVVFHTELGNQLLLQDKVGDARRSFKAASKIDESAMGPCLGGTRCLLLTGAVNDASSQLDFLFEISATTGRPAEMVLIKAEVESRKGAPMEAVLELLHKAVEMKTGLLATMSPGFEYFIEMDPAFLLLIVKMLLTFAPTEPILQGQVPSPALVSSNHILAPLVTGASGILQAIYLYAKVKYLSGFAETAKSLCQECINRDVSYGDAHLLMAKIFLFENNTRMALQSLEIGLSYNFELMESPIYHLIQAIIQRDKEEYHESLGTLNHALSLYEKNPRNADSSDKIAIYLQMVNVHRKLGQPVAAAQIMEKAAIEFKGTPSEIRVTLAEADLAVSRGDYSSAITILKSITPDKVYFSQARKKLADIFFHNRRDKKGYIKCFEELVEVNPNIENRILLGDAFVSVLMPEEAISVYEAALKKNPRNHLLAAKIGKAFVQTHSYTKAINYYETSLKQNPTAVELRYALVELLLKLKQHDKAQKILRNALTTLEEMQHLDTSNMVELSRYKELLGDSFRARTNLKESLNLYCSASEDLDKAVKRAIVEGHEQMEEFRTHLSSLYVKIGQHNCESRDFTVAVNNFRDALSHTPDNVGVLMSLARVYISMGQPDEAHGLCNEALKKSPGDVTARTVLATALYLKRQHEDAIKAFDNILNDQPDSYEALATLIDFFRRTGKSSESEKYLQLAEKSSAKVSQSPGFNYCRGLQCWYSGNSTQALKYFNLARKDATWGEKAVVAMVTICLNPDNDTMGGEVFKADADESAEQRENEILALKAAEKLMNDINTTNADSVMKLRILENQCLIATKNKQNIEQALENFMNIVSLQSENIAGLLGSAVAYMALKQVPKARNQLKRIAKMEWNPLDAEDFEQAWLLLSDIYITNNKYDLALDLIKKCTSHNESCSKAWEYMGFINEKESSYRDAAVNYERAWRYSAETNPTIGYKLAFNYLKAKRYSDAIIVCHKVLDHNPSYPKIRKEILDKARGYIRA